MPLPDPQGAYIRNHWQRGVGPLAERRGLILRPPSRQVRSRAAHETAAFAKRYGQFRAVNLELYRAWLEQGQDISDPAVLRAIVERAGLDGDALGRDLQARIDAPAVDRDVELARSLGIHSVPTMLVGRELAGAEPLVGAVPAEWLEESIRRALAGQPPPVRIRQQ